MTTPGLHLSTLRSAFRRFVDAVVRVTIVMTCCIGPASAYESDVHFGLTRFLALQAGFEPGQAESIAIGNQRVESGDMQFVALVFDYACLGRDPELAKEVSGRSYPSARQAPAAPAQRAVVAGGDVARAEVVRLDTVNSSQGGFRLYELGQALHVLQDSYAHEGTPDAPQYPSLFACDPEMTWAHPKARGGWSSHAADLTSRSATETADMAKATYDALIRYPVIGTKQRTAAPWEKVRPQLDGFIKASTKAEKQAWFASQGNTDPSFLSGISLSDGPQPFTLEWGGRRLPKLTALQSRQHETDPKLLDFFNRFFVDWLSRDDFDALAEANLGAASAAKPDKGVVADRIELAARLRLWRIRDHGAVAELAHAPTPLTRKQLGAITILAKSPAALARYPEPSEALFPLVTNTKVASPLLPFIVRKAPPSSTGLERAVAIAKLRHAPYDTVGIVAEQAAGSWKVISIVGTVDH
ncbi:MAG: hypothetical protein ABIN08_09580 [Caldimonas sp.]